MGNPEEDGDRIEIAIECLKEHFQLPADRRRLGTSEEIRELLKLAGRLQMERQDAMDKASHFTSTDGALLSDSSLLTEIGRTGAY